MKSIFIKELEEKDKKHIYNEFSEIIRKLILFWKVKLNKIIVKKIDENREIYLIPNIERKNICNKICEKILKEKTRTQKVQAVLAEKIKKHQKKFSKIKIVDGKNIMAENIESIVKFILKEKPIEMQSIYILTNSYDKESINIVKRLEASVKTINIITKSVEKYKVLEENLIKSGVAITIANNKRKSLKKAELIININMTNEELNTYQIFRNAVIINISKEKLTNIKGFEGTIVNNIDIALEPLEILKETNIGENFRKVEIYQTYTKEEKEKQKIHIKKLYGNNGEVKIE